MTRDPVTVILLGEPVAFARSRISRNGIHYTPAEQRNTMAALRMAAQQAMNDQAGAMFDEPIQLDLTADMAIPASWSKRKQARAIVGDVLPAKKPDLSNVVKLVEDALNGVVFRDDAQIVELHCRKRFSLSPKVVITVRGLSLPKTVETSRPGELPLVVAA